MGRKAFRCKNIYTAVSDQLTDGYVITENNRIIFVGSEGDGKAYIDSGTEVIDIRDHFIMPGFCDFHVHLVNSGQLEEDGILRYARSEEEAASTLWGIHQGKLENKKVIMGGSWDTLLWPENKNPTKFTLDRYFPDTPVYLQNKEGHGAWVNSALLRMFGIDKNTPDPQNGSYSRLENGEPDGYLHEKAAMNIQEKLYEMLGDEDFVRYSEAFVKKANQCGITSVGDVGGAGPIKDKAYKILEDEGRLTMRIQFYPLFDEGVEAIAEKVKRYNGPMLRCGGAKAFIDGTPAGHSGYMLEDYSDMPGERSAPFREPETFLQEVADFHQAGIQTRVHACGDAGARLCLDAVEEARRKYGSNDLRHCVEHLEAMHPDDISRFGKLDVIASVQPEHMPKYDFANHPFHGILGEERMKYSWPFESIRRSGGNLTFGSDSPVVDMTPFRGVFRAVTRLTNDGEPEGGWNPSERLGIHESLRAYTYGGAYACHREHELGTISVGKLADMVVTEHNLFECATDWQAMSDMKVLFTVVNGEIVYSAP